MEKRRVRIKKGDFDFSPQAVGCRYVAKLDESLGGGIIRGALPAHYSRISSTDRFRSFVDAALRIVRMARPHSRRIKCHALCVVAQRQQVPSVGLIGDPALAPGLAPECPGATHPAPKARTDRETTDRRMTD